MTPLEKDYECPVCGTVLKFPVQFEGCGHRCCANCLPELLRTTAKCPLDGTVVDRNRQVGHGLCVHFFQFRHLSN